jgi:c-di-AMP phosphodiesterase-like protein
MQKISLKMHHSEPFHYVLGFSIIGTVISYVEMNEALRFIILLGSAVGVVFKTWEQYRKSELLQQDLKKIWKKITGK